MRRNAESLLVLAGAETGPRRVRSIDVVDVVRAALSEVEDYERIDLGTLADATLHGPAVSDVAHILAELLENATHFSPPHTTVRVDGARSGGSYQIVINDRGVGMQPDQLDALNTVLRDPPVTGLALGRSLGCLVAARLAARHGITVRLRAGEHEGVSAYVILPRNLMVTEATDARGSGLDVTGNEPPAHLRDVLAAPGAFDASLQALLDGAAPPALVEPAIAPRDGDAAFRPPVPTPPGGPSAEPDGDATLSTLGSPANGFEPFAPVDRGALPAAASPSDQLPAAELVRRVPGAQTPTETTVSTEDRVRRSPDEVRALLSRYRSGLRAGRSEQADQEEQA